MSVAEHSLKLVSLKTHHISPTWEINGVSIVRIRENIDLFTMHCDVSGRMWSETGLIKDTPYLSLKWELWGVYCSNWDNIHPLQWRHNERYGVSNHQPHDCLLNLLSRHRWKKISKLRVTGPCEGISPVTGEFPTKRTNNAENIFIWWRRHGLFTMHCTVFSRW